MLEPTASVPIRQSLLLPKAVPDVEKVGIFDDDKVEEPVHNIHHEEGSCWNNFTNFFKNVKYNILGVTVKATVVWAIVYVIAIILNCVGDSWKSSCKEEKLWTIGPGGTLVNHHYDKTVTYAWGLEEIATSPGIFYIKKKDCKPQPKKWYSIPKTPATVNDITTTATLQNTDPKKGRKKRAGTEEPGAVSGAASEKASGAASEVASGAASEVASEVASGAASEVASGAASGAPKCLAQTFMDHKITPQKFVKDQKTQMWKMEPCDEKKFSKLCKKGTYFKLCLVEEKATTTVEKKDPKKTKIDTKTCVSATEQGQANVFESKQDCSSIIATNVANFRDFEKSTRKVLTILLGFFVATIVKRWWDQTSKIPRLDKLAMALNVIMQEETRGAESMKKVKHEILRLAALSYAIVMISLSGEYADKPEDVIKFLKDKKGLLKDKEIKALGFTEDQLKEKKRIFTATGAAMLKWWLPLNWAARIVQVEQKKGGHLPKEGKEIARHLIVIFNNLDHVADYSQRPMPKIALQAVQFVFWVSLVIGTLDNHHTNFDEKSGFRHTITHPILLLLLDVVGHLDELIVYILFYSWIKMAEIVQNPFDGHKHYDIDVEKQIDTELYTATAALHF